MNLALFAIVCALILATAALFRRRSDGAARAVSDPFAAASRCFEWEGTYAEAFQRTLDVLGALGAAVVQADPNRGTITGRVLPSPISFAPFGASFRAVLTTRGDTTFVEVHATPLVPMNATWGAAGLLSRFEAVWRRLPLPVSSATR